MVWSVAGSVDRLQHCIACSNPIALGELVPLHPEFSVTFGPGHFEESRATPARRNRFCAGRVVGMTVRHDNRG